MDFHSNYSLGNEIFTIIACEVKKVKVTSVTFKAKNDKVEVIYGGDTYVSVPEDQAYPNKDELIKHLSGK